MQFLDIATNTVLSGLSRIVGKSNLDEVLTRNELTRTHQIGKQFYQKCNDIINSAKTVTTDRKISHLNTLTGDADVFQSAALMSENEWKVFDAIGTLPGTLRMPDTVTIPSSASVHGGGGRSIPTLIYNKTINSLKEKDMVDPSIYTSFSTMRHTSLATGRGVRNQAGSFDVFSGFKIPWGDILLYSSLADDSVAFPVYPEELEDSRKANYVNMPETLYQYEPWFAYGTSGPRQVELTFTFHRDMWTGDHRDGCANDLIRFCEACCYPHYNGSAVHSATVRLYVKGKTFISGIMTAATTKWGGPIGLDGWYLACELTLSITEISDVALSFDSVRNFDVIGGLKS